MQKLQHRDRLRAGDRVRVRRQRWRVGDIRSFPDCSLVTLLGAGALNCGRELQVVAPFDRVETVEEPSGIRMVRMPFWRRQCRALIAGVRPAGALQRALYARIDLLPHQLEPALAMVRGLGSRVLIADEVGLGKTIQAGLIVAELQALGAVDRALVLTPAGLRDQWKAELFDRFALDAILVDMPAARRRAASLPAGLNPWATIPVAIASIDYVKRPEVLPAVLACHWDAVVVDEAHGVTPDSDRHRAVAALTARASYVVLLTATPHSGDGVSFDALCELGTIRRDEDRLLVFRRSRTDVGLGQCRRIHRVNVRASAAERHMHARLEQFSKALDRERRGDPAVALTQTLLHKRALSSARSLEASVVRRLADLDSSGTDSPDQLVLPLDDGGGELNTADEAPGWTWPAFADTDRERHLLERIADAARDAARRESKLVRLDGLLRRLAARNESAIVFTEYRDTLAHVRHAIARPCVVVHGGLSREERRRALDDFVAGRCLVLLATDAAGEGLNLHQACRVVVNLELPWNPMRLEQRIGRVDRIGQARRVHAFNLVARDTGERELFERLRTRVAVARDAIGTGDPLTSRTGDRIDRLSAAEAATTNLPTRSVPLVRLDDEAQLERQRLIGARLMLTGAPSVAPLGGVRPYLARTRTPATRVALGNHLLAILQLAIEDTAGHLVAMQLLPLLVRANHGVCRQPAVLETLLRGLETTLTDFHDTSTRDWFLKTKTVVEAFWQQRMAREQSILEALLANRVLESQPGLFDRRAEQAVAERVEAGLEQIRDAERRIEAIRSRCVTGPAETRVALLLVN